MISLLAEKAVDAFIECSVIAKDDRDLYVYGFFMLISKIFYFIWTVLVGAIFGVVIECIVYYLLFSILREYAGGIHASKEPTCMVCTSLSILISIIAIWAGYKFSLTLIFTCLIILGATIIIVLCPQDSEAKRLTKTERQLYKRKTITCIVFILVGGGIALFTNHIGVFLSCSVCITLESVLLLLGRTMNSRTNL